MKLMSRLSSFLQRGEARHLSHYPSSLCLQPPSPHDKTSHQRKRLDCRGQIYSLAYRQAITQCMFKYSNKFNMKQSPICGLICQPAIDWNGKVILPSYIIKYFLLTWNLDVTVGQSHTCFTASEGTFI